MFCIWLGCKDFKGFMIFQISLSCQLSVDLGLLGCAVEAKYHPICLEFALSTAFNKAP